MEQKSTLKRCFLWPPAAARVAEGLLREAELAHLAGDRARCEELLCKANLDELREWTESLWGKNSPYVNIVSREKDLAISERVAARMPNAAEKAAIHERDGYHCRFCGLAVITSKVRKRICELYPLAVPWGRTNSSQHAAFQAMWAQYDHIVPHSKGGTNDLSNVVLTCAPCNFARMDYSLSEVGLENPLKFEVRVSDWDGLIKIT